MMVIVLMILMMVMPSPFAEGVDPEVVHILGMIFAMHAARSAYLTPDPLGGSHMVGQCSPERKGSATTRIGPPSFATRSGSRYDPSLWILPTITRRWWQRTPVRLSVRALMVVVLIVACGFGWVVNQAHAQRDAIQAIEKAGGKGGFYDWQLKLIVTPDLEGPEFERPERQARQAENGSSTGSGPTYYSTVKLVMIRGDADQVMSHVGPAHLARRDRLHAHQPDRPDDGAVGLGDGTPSRPDPVAASQSGRQHSRAGRSARNE